MEALILGNKIAEAIDYSTKLQNQWIDNPEFLFWRGRLLIYNGNMDLGKKYLREALSKDPDNINYQKGWRNLVKMEKVKKEATDFFSASQF